MHQSHLALMDSSALPYLRLAQSGHTLALERRASPNDSDIPVSRDYQFGSTAEAKAWFEVCKEHLRQKAPPRYQEHINLDSEGDDRRPRRTPRPAG